MRYGSLWFIIATLFCIVLGLTLFFNAHENRDNIPQNKQITLAAVEDITMREVDAKSGHVFILEAKQVSVPLDQNSIPCNDATITISKNNIPIGVLQVETAVIDRPNKEITCSNKVTGTLLDVAFSTIACCYSFAVQTITLPAPIEIVSHQATTQAGHGLIDIKTKEIFLMGGVSTVLKTSNNPTSNHRGYRSGIIRK